MGLIQALSSLAAGGRRPGEPNVRSVMDRMHALAVKGRFPEALRYGAAHAPRLDSVELWEGLSTLRIQAAGAAAERAKPRAVWPPALPDPFPGAILPEIEASELGWRKLGGGVLHHGSLIVRNLVDAGAALRLRSRIDETIEAYDRHQEGGALVQRCAAYLPIALNDSEALALTRGWSRASGGVWAVEAPSVLDEVITLYRDAGLIKAIGDYLGEPPLISVGKTVLRRAEPVGSGGFHQDGAFMGAQTRALNVWLALSDCGVDAPGLEVVPARLSSIVETGTEGAAFDWAVGRSVAIRTAGERGLAMPPFRAGDALIFDHLMLHSTGYLPGMTQRRYAVEAWFFAPSAAPQDQVPLAI